MSLASFCADSITIEKCVGHDAFDTLSFGPPVSYKCRIRQDTKEIRNMSGQTILRSAVITFPGVVDISTEDRITLPDGSQPVVVNIHVAKTLQKQHHTVIDVS